ncbi:MAG: YraN family protein [Spirochaetaceae bacterium]|nr:YraN family protein [Spirochaetaceae bacterium]
MIGIPPSRASLGRDGEAVAASFLESEGWTIVARNFRWKGGEIDIAAERADEIAFIEVKSWRSYGPEELDRAIGSDKRRRIVETSKIFLARNRQYSSRRVRFDVILVRGGEIAERYESAFTGEL